MLITFMGLIKFPHPLVPFPYAFHNPVFLFINQSLHRCLVFDFKDSRMKETAQSCHPPSLGYTVCVRGGPPLWPPHLLWLGRVYVKCFSFHSATVYPSTCYPPRNMFCCLRHFSSLWPSARVLMIYNRNFSRIFRPRVWHHGLEWIVLLRAFFQIPGGQRGWKRVRELSLIKN